MSGVIGVGTDETSGIVGKFPSGHVLQTVDATLSSVATAEAPHTGTAIVAVADSQINITAGNKVFIYAQAPLRIIGSSNAAIVAKLKEGTTASGTVISESNFMNNGSGATFHSPHFYVALDASPASTSPSYTMTMEKSSGGTTSVSLYSSSTTYVKMILMEIQG